MASRLLRGTRALLGAAKQTGHPSFWLLLFTQGLSAGGEFFGYRHSRIVHKRSVLRQLTSVTIYSAVQAFVILAILYLALPAGVTERQGSLWLPLGLARCPGIWVNAFNNTIYWVALIYVLREPLGAVLVVLAFILASLFISPFERVVGMSGDAPPGALGVMLAIIGTVLCIMTLPPSWRGSWVSLSTAFGCLSPATKTRPRDDSGDNRLYRQPSEAQISATDEHAAQLRTATKNPRGYVSEGCGEQPEDGATSPLLGQGGSHDHGTSNGHENGSSLQSAPRIYAENRDDSCGGWSRLELWHVATVGLAFVVLALTAGVGIVCTTYLEEKCDITMFGYAAADQIMLPVTSLPLVWAAAAWPRLAEFLGEPTDRIEELGNARGTGRGKSRGSEGAGSGSVGGEGDGTDVTSTEAGTGAVPLGSSGPGLGPSHEEDEDGGLGGRQSGLDGGAVAVAVAPVEIQAEAVASTREQASCGGCEQCGCGRFGRLLGLSWSETEWVSLVLFRALQFGREFLFFYLATAFVDLSGTYLEMTVLRVVLCWGVSILAATLARRYIGISEAEARAELAPAHLLMRLAGSGLLTLSYLSINDVV